MAWLLLQEWSRPLPRIEDRLLNSVVYLYANKDDAESGEPGASGFLVGEPCALPNTVLLFAVTNVHVIEHCPVVRTAGPPESDRVFVRREGDWIRHAKKHDIAVTPIAFAPTNSRDLYRNYVPREWCVTPENFTESVLGEDRPQPLGSPFGAGEEVVMLGRFLAHDGTEQNQPSARFGHLAMGAPVPVKQKGRSWQESFVVECRSVTGYSGSPVFIFRPAALYGGGLLPIGADQATTANLPRLLGIDWGNLNRVGLYDYAIDWSDADAAKSYAAWSGMLAAVPAWHLAELLDSPEVQDVRKKLEADAKKGDAELDFATSEFDRFEALTRKLVKVSKKQIDKKRKDKS
jgi:hypothetical protein